MLIAARVMDFNVYLAPPDSLGSLINIKHCRFIVFWERVVEVVSDKAGLSYGGVTDEYNLNLLWSRGINIWPRTFWHIIFDHNWLGLCYILWIIWFNQLRLGLGLIFGLIFILSRGSDLDVLSPFTWLAWSLDFSRLRAFAFCWTNSVSHDFGYQ